MKLKIAGDVSVNDARYVVGYGYNMCVRRILLVLTRLWIITQGIKFSISRLFGARSLPIHSCS